MLTKWILSGYGSHNSFTWFIVKYKMFFFTIYYSISLFKLCIITMCSKTFKLCGQDSTRCPSFIYFFVFCLLGGIGWVLFLTFVTQLMLNPGYVAVPSPYAQGRQACQQPSTVWRPAHAPAEGTTKGQAVSGCLWPRLRSWLITVCIQRCHKPRFHNWNFWEARFPK